MMPKADVTFVSRKASASPATGFSKVHKIEQDKIVSQAFEI
jgi:2-oxoglutarate dehydrogenase E1 component